MAAGKLGYRARDNLAKLWNSSIQYAQRQDMGKLFQKIGQVYELLRPEGGSQVQVVAEEQDTEMGSPELVVAGDIGENEIERNHGENDRAKNCGKNQKIEEDTKKESDFGSKKVDRMEAIKAKKKLGQKPRNREREKSTSRNSY